MHKAALMRRKPPNVERRRPRARRFALRLAATSCRRADSSAFLIPVQERAPLSTRGGIQQSSLVFVDATGAVQGEQSAPERHRLVALREARTKQSPQRGSVTRAHPREKVVFDVV